MDRGWRGWARIGKTGRGFYPRYPRHPRFKILPHAAYIFQFNRRSATYPDAVTYQGLKALATSGSSLRDDSEPDCKARIYPRAQTLYALRKSDDEDANIRHAHALRHGRRSHLSAFRGAQRPGIRGDCGFALWLAFTSALPSTAAEAVSYVGSLLICALGWMAIQGPAVFSIRRGAHPLWEMARLALYFIAGWLFVHVQITSTSPPSHTGGDVYFAGYLVLLALWWVGMIGAGGSLVSREAHPVRALLLLGFFVAAAVLVIWWVFWRVTPQTPLFKPTESI